MVSNKELLATLGVHGRKMIECHVTSCDGTVTTTLMHTWTILCYSVILFHFVTHVVRQTQHM